MTTSTPTPTPTPRTPTPVSGTLAAVGHFGVAGCYLLGVLCPLAGLLQPLIVLTVLLAGFQVVLGLGWLRARPAFGPVAVTIAVLSFVSPALATGVGLVIGSGSGEFAIIGGVLIAGIVVGVLEIAADIATAVALAGHLDRDGAAARVGLWLALAPAAVALIGLALGASGVGVVSGVAVTLAALSHLAVGLVSLRLAARTRPA